MSDTIHRQLSANTHCHPRSRPGAPTIFEGGLRVSGHLAVILAAALLVIGPVLGTTAQAKPANVLLLNGADSHLPAILAIESAIRDTVLEGHGDRVEFFYESLDMLRFPADLYGEDLARLFEKKYRDIDIDVVVAAAPVAVNFVETHRGSIWTGAKLVYHSVPRSMALKSQEAGIPSVPLEYPLREAAELAVALNGRTKRLIVAAGDAGYDRYVLAQARSKLGEIFLDARVEYLDGLPALELLSRLSSLGEGDVVLYLTYFRDRDGDVYIPRDMLRRISAASPVPVVGIADSYLGSGIAGGAFVPYEAQGRKAGELVLSALAHENFDSRSKTQPLKPECVVDWRTLSRLDIDTNRVPEGCQIRFKPFSPWQAFRWQIIGTFSVILIQAWLIAMLIIQHRRRRRAEVDAQRARYDLFRAARLTNLGELTASISHEINQPLGAILNNAEAAAMMLDTRHPDIEEIRRIIEDIRVDDLRASDVIRQVRGLLSDAAIAREPVEVNGLVRELVTLLQSEARRRGARITTRLDARIPPVHGDAVLLRQVLLNLVINGLEAMSDTPESRRVLTLETSASDAGVTVRVADRGHGILPDVESRVFDSFYTTKPRGLGIGLSIVRSIIESHGGSISTFPNLDGGTVFSFFLPASTPEAAPAQGITTATPEPAR